MTTIAVELGPVQETLLIPLLGRAEETERAAGLIDDPKAVEIVRSLAYDFEKWRGIRSLRGASLRTRMMDDDVRSFLAAHPKGTVVEIGCGLNSRFDRLDNGTVRWFDLDLPDAIALRRRFYDDRARCSMLPSSVTDEEWLDTVEASPGPHCFVAEASLIYLPEAQVRRVVETLGQRFPGSWLITDTTSSQMVDNQDRHDAMRHMPRGSWFRWACDDPRTLEEWAGGWRLDRARTFFDAGDDLLGRLPRWMRWYMRYAPRALTRSVRGYRINRLVAGLAAAGE